MKKFAKTLLAAAAALTLALPVSAMAAETPVTLPAALGGQYVEAYPTVLKVISDKQILVKDGNEEIVYNLADAVLYSQITTKPVAVKDLNVGDALYAAYPANTPKALSSPAQIAPQVVVVCLAADGKPNVKTDVFTDGLSSDGKLAIPKTISAATPVTLPDGKEFRSVAALNGATLMIFYGVETRSLPPIATPDKIVVLAYAESGEAVTPPVGVMPTVPVLSGVSADAEQFAREYLLGDEVLVRDGVTYVQLRKVAESLGFEVTWAESARTVTLTRDALHYGITIGSASYGFNRALGTFANAPIICNDRTFVEAAFIDTLLK